MELLRAAFFASGRGSNANVLINAMRAGWIAAEPVVLVSDRESAAETLAFEHNIPFVRIVPKQFDSPQKWREAMIDAVTWYEVDVLFLCGFLRLLPAEICRSHAGKILNIHPGKLPEYGGSGMWGHHVHAAVIAAGEQWSGPTVHFVNEVYDDGEIMAHLPVPVFPDDTPDSLAKRILPAEHTLYPYCAALLCNRLLNQK